MLLSRQQRPSLMTIAAFLPLRLRSGVREMLSELSSRSIATDGFIQLSAGHGGRGRRAGEREAALLWLAARERSTPPSSFLRSSAPPLTPLPF